MPDRLDLWPVSVDVADTGARADKLEKPTMATDEPTTATGDGDTASESIKRDPEPTEPRDLSLDDIYAAHDITINPVDVPEWGGRVYVRTMSGTQKEKYVESIRKVVGSGKKKDVQWVLQESSAKLVALTMCRKDGTLMIPPTEPEASRNQMIKKLGAKSNVALGRVVDAASKLNGLSDEGDEEAKNDLPATTETTDSSNTV